MLLPNPFRLYTLIVCVGSYLRIIVRHLCSAHADCTSFDPILCSTNCNFIPVRWLWMIKFVFGLLLFVMSNCLFICKRPLVQLHTLKFRPYRTSITRMTSTSSVVFPDKSLALMRTRTTLASVEGMVRQSVGALFKDSQVSMDDSSNLNPMVFLGKPEFGDYQCNIALTLTKQLKMKPKDIAERLMDTMMQSETHSAIPVVQSMDISGPGFINIHLSPQYLQYKLQHMQAHSAGQEEGSLSRLGIDKVTAPQKIVVDFSSPNIAKEMHVGHLRSTIIGDSLARVLEFLGHDVLRLNHVGDWGTQFGMIIHYLKTHHPASLPSTVKAEGQPGQQKQEQVQLQGVDIGDLVEFYKAAKRCFDADPAFKDAARREVVSLQAGDPQSLAAWTAICDKSRAEFQQIYALLRVNLTERGESFYNPLLPGLVQRLKESGVVQTSEGAECIFVEGHKNSDGTPLPLIVQKSDGGYLYATTDLAALYHRVHEELADRVIYVTDAGQAQHFSMVFKAAEMAGILHRDSNNKKVELTHVPFGLVLGEDGKKIKSRAGDSVKLRELLAEAVRLAAENEAARIGSSSAVAGVDTPTLGQAGDVGNVLSALEQGPLGLHLQDKARVIGLGAVKYADLSMHRESNYKFSFNKMLSLSGNTAPYMLYAYVRIRGIQRRAAASLQSEDQDQDQQTGAHLVLESPAELALAKQLVRFHEVLLDVSVSLCPNKLCEYMYELAQRFNGFYECCPVLQAESRELRGSRTALCALTADTLKLSLDLLGIDTVEKM